MSPDPDPADPEHAARRARPRLLEPPSPSGQQRRGRQPQPRCSSCATACRRSPRPPPALAEACAALAAGDRAGGHRRRACLRLPLLLARLPDPAPPRGRRDVPGRPDRLRRPWRRCRRPSAGAEWILHAATQDLPCLREVGLRPTALFDTELAARLLGYPRVGPGDAGRDAPGLPDEEGALRGRLVDATAAHAVAGVRRPRRRGAGRAARRARRGAASGREGRVGASGVRCAARLHARSAHRAVAAYLGAPPRARPATAGRRARAVGGA